MLLGKLHIEYAKTFSMIQSCRVQILSCCMLLSILKTTIPFTMETQMHTEGPIWVLYFIVMRSPLCDGNICIWPCNLHLCFHGKRNAVFFVYFRKYVLGLDEQNEYLLLPPISEKL